MREDSLSLMCEYLSIASIPLATVLVEKERRGTERESIIARVDEPIYVS